MPCKCSGSVGFIHYECLKNWLAFLGYTNIESNIEKSFIKNDVEDKKANNTDEIDVYQKDTAFPVKKLKGLP